MPLPPSDRTSGSRTLPAPRPGAAAAARRVGAIDIGSNSVRIAIVEVCGDVLHVVEEASVTPRLIRDVEATGEFSRASIDGVLAILDDFRAIARGAGVDTISAVATSAARDATNGDTLVQRAHHELDMDVSIIDGRQEAHFAFAGAVHSLPVDHGLVIDIGGGSLEIVQFSERRVVSAWSLPLGAVRLTDEFLHSDPPTASELEALRTFLGQQIAGTGMPELEPGGVVVGTGGTIRNIAKMDRPRKKYPLHRLHGYEVATPDLHRLVGVLAGRTADERRATSGLNEDRADSIVAGAIAVEAILDAVGARGLVVSGQGLREGVALAAVGRDLPDVPTLRRAALDDAVDAFTPDLRRRAEHRVALVEELAGLCDFDLPADVLRTLSAAALLIDLGRRIDYYGLHRHTESLLLSRGLAGWSHRELALICALVRQADHETYTPSAFRPLIRKDDRRALSIAGAFLALADGVVRRLAHDAEPFAWRLTGDDLGCTNPQLAAGLSRELGDRVTRVLGLRLAVD